MSIEWLGNDGDIHTFRRSDGLCVAVVARDSEVALVYAKRAYDENDAAPASFKLSNGKALALGTEVCGRRITALDYENGLVVFRHSGKPIPVATVVHWANQELGKENE